MDVWKFTSLDILTLLTLLTDNILNVPLQQKLRGSLEALIFPLNEIIQHGNFASGQKETINSDITVLISWAIISDMK